VIVQGLVEWHKYPVGLACQLVDLPRSSFYYQRRKADESYLEGNLKTVAGQFPTYGTRRITHQLWRSPYWYHFNRKHIPSNAQIEPIATGQTQKMPYNQQ
jgi:hypothetical protein